MQLLHPSDPPGPLPLETDALKKTVRGAALCDQQRPFDLRRNGAYFVDQKTADSLSPNIARYNNVVDVHRVGRDLHCDDADDVPDELSEQATRRNLAVSSLRPEKNAYSIVVG